MSLFYDRIETHNDITIIYKYQVLFYLFLLALLAIGYTDIIKATWGLCLFIAILFLLISSIIAKIKPNSEIKNAMQKGKVEVSGNKFSFKNPITFRIKK